MEPGSGGSRQPPEIGSTEGGNCSTIRLVRRPLLILAGIAFAWGLIVILTGGVDWRIAGHAVRSRNPERAFIIGIMLLLAQAIAYRGSFARDTARVTAAVKPLLPGLALAFAVALAAYAAHYGAFYA